MRLIFTFLFLGLVYSNALAQKDTTHYQIDKVFLLDSSWTIGANKKTPLKDSVSYFEITGSKVEFVAVSSSGTWKEKGKVIRWTETKLENGLDSYHFYLASRGGLKGTLTVTIRQLNETKYEIQMVSPFSTIDKKIIARAGSRDLIIRPVEKPKKPKKK
ncbi:MAG: hypothetical protein EP305_12920 [Bacteroidetes bacterium]|nr:MAG: hypothetical protein EP305_12920 [Bacteroidota bacterium]